MILTNIHGTPIWQTGGWSGSVTYKVGYAVAYLGSSYVCILEHTNHAPPNGTYWEVLSAKGTDGTDGIDGTDGTNGTPVWKGAWSSSTAYFVGDAVFDSGTSYVCNSSHTNHEPPNASYWDVLAQKGDKGDAGSGGVTRYTATDANTLLQWKMGESSSPCVSTGSNTLNLTVLRGTPIYGASPLFDGAIHLNGSACWASGNSSVEPTTNSMTWMAWVFINSFKNGASIVFKEDNGSHDWPYGMGLTLSGTSGGWQPLLVVASTLYAPDIQAKPWLMPLQQRTLLAMTFDGSNLRSYINGTLANTTAALGNANFGNHAQWCVGGYANAAGYEIDGIVEDVRIESVVRSASYLRALYRNGIGWSA